MDLSAALEIAAAGLELHGDNLVGKIVGVNIYGNAICKQSAVICCKLMCSTASKLDQPAICSSEFTQLSFDVPVV